MVGVEECLGLSTTTVVEAGINSTALYDVLKVEIGLSVTYQIDFFAAQFSVILAASIVNQNQLTPLLLQLIIHLQSTNNR